jgi:hypothetical protein
MMKRLTAARTSPKQVPNVTPVASLSARVMAPNYQPRRLPYARALYAAAVAALLAACTPPERSPTPDVPELVRPSAASVDSAVGLSEELPVVVVQAKREMPEVVVRAPRRRVVELIG